MTEQQPTEKDRRSEHPVAVRGGFFWIGEGGEGAGIEQRKPEVTLLVADCAFIARPRWWQVRRWWRALKVLRGLPVHEYGGRFYVDGINRGFWGKYPESPEWEDSSL